MIKIKTRPNELYFLLNHESAMEILKIFNKMGGDVKVVDQENTIITFILGDDERYYKNQSKIEKSNPDSVLKSLTISKIKQFDFNSHIISIYGAYEHFIEQLITKYLDEICAITRNYNSLPEEIQKNN